MEPFLEELLCFDCRDVEQTDNEMFFAVLTLPRLTVSLSPPYCYRPARPAANQHIKILQSHSFNARSRAQFAVNCPTCGHSFAHVALYNSVQF